MCVGEVSEFLPCSVDGLLLLGIFSVVVAEGDQKRDGSVLVASILD
jgi:hypothetical protein